MSEDIYARPDLTKKVRFQKGEKEEDRNADVYDNNNATIYENSWKERSTLPKSQENTSKDQQQTASVNVSSGKKNLVRAAVLFLLLLYLLLLTAVIVLLVIVIHDKDLNAILTSERHQLQINYSNIERVNAILTSERHQLQINYSNIERVNANLTQKTSQLENANVYLMDVNSNLTKEKMELQKEIENSCCPADWKRFCNSCYFIPTSKLNWSNSKKYCETLNAHLVIISNREEQEFITSLIQTTNSYYWIGLTDQETESQWKWVNGTVATTT
ncbi:asialoglycoprotein receptor 1-like [Mastacembelus armatus]|uniref:asialoglycoprotein receptor 1-like n=1 Tax=Mastacembelus armatus TaxID=205130 RepID=UPI000E4662D3|nr:asialoglycoprotein receptor 1-like [Mastacembelus armatus]